MKKARIAAAVLAIMCLLLLGANLAFDRYWSAALMAICALINCICYSRLTKMVRAGLGGK